MFYLLGHEDTLKMVPTINFLFFTFELQLYDLLLLQAVKLESQRINRTRYLVIASRCCYRPVITEKRNRIIRHNSTRITNTTSCRTQNQSGLINTTPSNAPFTPADNGVGVGVGGMQKIKKFDERQNSKFNNNILEQDNLLGSGDNSRNLNKTNTAQSGGNPSLTAANAAINLHNCCFEESCLLGIDCNENTTIGLVVPILADTTIHLDGDGYVRKMLKNTLESFLFN